MRKVYKGNFLVVGGYSSEDVNEVIWSGKVDMVVFGWLFLVNFDFFKWIVFNVLFNKYDRLIFYI